MKLRKLHIDNYKMFKDFDISFVDENDEPLPIVILAGVNGSGKTSILEFIHNYKEESLTWEGNKIEYYNTIYFSTDTSIENIQELMPEYLRKIVWDEDIKASEAFSRVRDFANNIFKDIDIQIEFDSRDGEKNLYFRNKNGGDRFSIDALSTGEKTLVSKILYMYLADIKNHIILIDEPELSLHPSWQNKILKLYEDFAIQNSCQIIIATHSPHVIGSAKHESIRLLLKDNNNYIKVVDNIDKSYGLQFDKILTDIMGVENLRTPAVAKNIRRLWELLEDEAYESEEYIKLYTELEDILGNLDEDMVLSRLEIARIKSRNANSK